MLFIKKPKFHNALIDALHEPAFVFDPQGAFRYGNKAGSELLKIMGYGPVQNALTYDDFIKATNAFEDGAVVELAGTRYRRENQTFADGTLLRFFPLQEDVHLLRMSQALAVMPWGVMSLDLSCEGWPVLFCNQMAGKFLQAPSENISGHSIGEVLRVAGIKGDLSACIQGEDISHYDHEGKIGERICWYRLHFIPYGQKGRHCLIVFEDTTENKIMEGHYFQSQRLEALGQLAGGVAHDFNNILSIIDGYARIARKTVADVPDALNYLERIGQAVQRGSALTNQLLTFGRHKVRKDSVFDLGELVRDQEALLRPLMDASISLSLHADMDIMVEVPPDNICQILMNLCINSRDAMPGGGNLIIEATKSQDGDNALLRIIDTGIGMTPDVRARMFDPFFTTKDQGKGTGLGLSMVYGLVKDMKGDIEVVSKPGSGTAITIRLPISLREKPVHEVIEHEDGSVTLNGFTAMIAEDEPDLLNLLSGMLEDMGMQVLRATNGAEALALQDEYQGDIDFLLTDVVMPEVNGVMLAEMFEAVRPSAKIVFMSGYPTRGQMSRVQVPEGAFLMPKPLDFHKLGVVIKTMAMEQNNYMKERLKKMTGQWKTA